MARTSTTTVVAPDVASAESPAATTFRFTLRTKSVIALFVFVAYVVVIALYVTHERGRLFHIVQQLEQVHERHELLTHVNTGLTHSIVTLQNLLNSGDIQPPIDDILLDLASFEPSLPTLKATYPETVQIVMRFERNVSEFVKRRTTDATKALRDSEQTLAAQLEYFENEVERSSERLSREYRELNQQISSFTLIMNLIGLPVFGLVVTIFFSKLASDIKRLGTRAQLIVAGYRGTPIKVSRHDELGDLMTAINRMQSDLNLKEHQQEISRQRRFHQEKMAAVGSLAAAVAHEVSNPINSISGIAQYTIDAIRSHRRMDDETLCSNAELVLKQTERIGSIVRHIADLSAPRSPDPELLDVNELVQTSCNFIRYDKRFRHVDLVVDLDGDLPAIGAVADHLTQVLMNLLINAADAMEGLVGRKPIIRVSTRQDDAGIILSVCDNGQGMDSAVLAHAFDQSYTTKPAGKGRGIGLHLCKALIEEIGGGIELESSSGVGTTALVRLPLHHGAPA